MVLGLELAADKTEAILFRGRIAPDFDPLIRVGRTYVKTSLHIKYLGIILDARMSFLPHFRYVSDKIAGVTRALFRLMPNLRGPSEKKRRLYAMIVSSVALYGAPIWSRPLLRSGVALRIIHKIQRQIAIKVCAAYRTTSRDAALLIARTSPYELVAEERTTIYERGMVLRESGEWSEEAIRNVRREARLLQEKWILCLRERDAAGVRTRDAILPNLENWMNRGWGGVNFHVTQFLTGHGCFGSYLHRIGGGAGLLALLRGL